MSSVKNFFKSYFIFPSGLDVSSVFSKANRFWSFWRLSKSDLFQCAGPKIQTIEDSFIPLPLQHHIFLWEMDISN